MPAPDESWVRIAVAEAVFHHPEFDQALVAAAEQLLSGRLSRSRLTKAELTQAASDLLALLERPLLGAEQ